MADGKVFEKEDMKDIANVLTKDEIDKLISQLNNARAEYRIYQQNIENIVAFFDYEQCKYYKAYSNCVREKNKEECKNLQDVIDGLEMVKGRMKELHCGFDKPFKNTVISILNTFKGGIKW